MLFLLLTLNVRQKCSEQKLTLPWCIDLERQRCKLWHGSQTPQNKSDIERIIRGFIYAKVISRTEAWRDGAFVLCWILDIGHISCHCFTNYLINPHIPHWRLHISLSFSTKFNLTFHKQNTLIDRYWLEVLGENIRSRSVYGITLMVWLGWAGGSGDVGRVCDICRLENWSDGGTERSNYGGGGGRVVADTGTQTSRTCWHPDHWVNTMLLWTCVVILWIYVILRRWEL